MSRISKTAIVFPRISNHDGPARTLNKSDFIDVGCEAQNPLYNPLHNGYSDATTHLKSNLQLMVTLEAPIPLTQESRNSQRFRSNFKQPDQTTKNLIRRRRGI